MRAGNLQWTHQLGTSSIDDGRSYRPTDWEMSTSPDTRMAAWQERALVAMTRL